MTADLSEDVAFPSAMSGAVSGLLEGVAFAVPLLPWTLIPGCGAGLVFPAAMLVVFEMLEIIGAALACTTVDDGGGVSVAAGALCVCVGAWVCTGMGNTVGLSIRGGPTSSSCRTCRLWMNPIV